MCVAKGASDEKYYETLIVESKRNYIMAISYNGLWKLLIDKGMKKGDLCKSTGLSSSTMAKMTNGESVNLSVLERICEKLDCDFADLVNYKRTQEEADGDEQQ